MRPAAPNPSLRAVVVVPARDEEDLIGACLHSLAAQDGIPQEEYEVILVLDRCSDGTEARAAEVAAEHPRLRLSVLQGPGKGSGFARRIGMETAYRRLAGLGRQDGLIASTDADTVVAPDWLAAQLRAAGAGARAIGGRIDLADDGTLPPGVRRWHADYGRERYDRLLSQPDRQGATEHWQFSGASLALTAGTYREIGGLRPLTFLEDEYLEGVLRRRGIPIDRLLSVRVTTSPRLKGRAGRGLSRDLSEAAFRHQASAAGKDLRTDARSS